MTANADLLLLASFFTPLLNESKVSIIICSKKILKKVGDDQGDQKVQGHFLDTFDIR